MIIETETIHAGLKLIFFAFQQPNQSLKGDCWRTGKEQVLQETVCLYLSVSQHYVQTAREVTMEGFSGRPLGVSACHIYIYTVLYISLYICPCVLCVWHSCPSVWQRDNAEPSWSRFYLLLWLLVLGLLWERWIEGNSSVWVRGLGLQTCSSPVWDFVPDARHLKSARD